MNMLTFSEWVKHWGETKLTEHIERSQRNGQRMWNDRNSSYALWSYPAWELYLGNYWQESIEEWHVRWHKCGGRLSEGRMIAAKWDSIWEQLSNTFYDGLNTPYPPYARSSCASWKEIGQDEAIFIGAISERSFNEYMAKQAPSEPLMDKDGKPISKELLESVARELEEDIYRNGGPRPGATRAERVEHERKRKEESAAKAQLEYEKRNAERAEENAVFRLLEEVERTLRSATTVQDPRRSEWLATSLVTLTTTPYFDSYPNWRARAWLAKANLCEQTSDPTNELAYLEKAIAINPKLPVKKRIKKLHEKA